SGSARLLCRPSEIIASMRSRRISLLCRGPAPSQPRKPSSICCILVYIELPTLSFHAEHLGFTYGLAGATFELPSTGLIAVVGPNGAGKSTLVSILAGLR